MTKPVVTKSTPTTNQDVAVKALDTGKDVLLGILKMPLVQILAANVIIEMLQHVEVNKVPAEWETVYQDPDAIPAPIEWGWQPGWGNKRVKEALMSPFLAGSLETIINSAGTVELLIKALGADDIFQILSFFGIGGA